MKRLPIGVENFKTMIDKDFYYVDKTSFIQDVLNEEVILYTRPRRFGKTLNMSMLYYFFSIKEKENANLFHGLSIMSNPKALTYQNRYPVIFLTLKDMKNNTFEKQLKMFSKIIVNIIEAFPELWDSDKLSSASLKTIEMYHEGAQEEIDLQVSLQFIAQCLMQHYGKKVIIIIDEYDVPLQNAYLNGYYDDMVNFLRNVFSTALKTNDALEKGVLTGCLRIAKESIFTGLNNFKVNSIFDEVSRQRFGFTQSEIDLLLQAYHAEEYKAVIKEWYDGYEFGGCDVYNPWSVLMYMDRFLNSSRKMPESFWVNTSGNDIIYRYVKEANPLMREEFDVLASGGMIEKPIKDDLTYREMDQINNVYSFLLYTGYLKVVSCVNEEEKRYRLMIPNKEIKRVYVSIFREWFDEQIKNNGATFVEALKQKDISGATELLNTVLFQSISYFDYDEKFYHGLLLGMMSEYQIVSNQESGLGRSDITLLPISRLSRGVLLELKVAKREEDLQKLAEQACKQIIDMKYIEGLERKGYKDIIGYGIAFYKKSCVIAAVLD
ncbi:ATP-binding protein [[Clostridium] innocuum]|nr:ATP-binding protein [[Clostridium] innocuum]